LRPERFVTRKIVTAACRIADGSVERDWDWAPEYVEAMWLMLQQEKPEDYIIAKGQTHSLEEFVSTAFLEVGLYWRKHVISTPSFFRPSDIQTVSVNPQRAKDCLGWRSRNNMYDVIRPMVTYELTKQLY
jgi:GDPmannose 4,6-dehydratase